MSLNLIKKSKQKYEKMIERRKLKRTLDTKTANVLRKENILGTFSSDYFPGGQDRGLCVVIHLLDGCDEELDTRFCYAVVYSKQINEDIKWKSLYLVDLDKEHSYLIGDGPKRGRGVAEWERYPDYDFEILSHQYFQDKSLVEVCSGITIGTSGVSEINLRE